MKWSSYCFLLQWDIHRNVGTLSTTLVQHLVNIIYVDVQCFLFSDILTRGGNIQFFPIRAVAMTISILYLYCKNFQNSFLYKSILNRYKMK